LGSVKDETMFRGRLEALGEDAGQLVCGVDSDQAGAPILDDLVRKVLPNVHVLRFARSRPQRRGLRIRCRPCPHAPLSVPLVTEPLAAESRTRSCPHARRPSLRSEPHVDSLSNRSRRMQRAGSAAQRARCFRWSAASAATQYSGVPPPPLWTVRWSSVAANAI
jgi:hypothetical protein